MFILKKVVFNMVYEFIKYPKNKIDLSNELKRVVDDYTSRKIGNDEFKDIILWYAIKCPNNLFRNQEYNATIKRLVGKRRLDLMDMVLEGVQLTFYKGVK